MNRNQKAYLIFNHYGEDHQSKKLGEETGEFLTAFYKWEAKRKEIVEASARRIITPEEVRELDRLGEAVCEEWADVNVVFLQFQEAFNRTLPQKKVFDFIEAKINRQLERMKEESRA